MSWRRAFQGVSWTTPSPGLASPSPPRPESADGDALRLEDVFRQHADFVARVLRRLDVPDTDLDDALQEVFLTVAAKLDGYEERGSLRAWLFTIARQVASHARRAQSRRLVREGKAYQLHVVPEQSPEQTAHNREAARLLQGFLHSLPAEQAMAFYLAEVEELSAPEIAACEGAKLNTVYARIRLARRRFARFLRTLEAREARDE